MRNAIIVGITVAALLSIASMPSAHEPVAEADDTVQAADRSVEITSLGSRLPEPVRSVRLREYLYRASDFFSDAYADRSENPLGRITRLENFSNGIADAIEADWRVPMLGDDDWRYAMTLVCIAHRETRISRNPAKLGNQDSGRAHGAWQIWSWHGQDPFSAKTALDMLLTDPSHSWSLPKDHPWIGYPDCAKYIDEHPFE